MHSQNLVQDARDVELFMRHVLLICFTCKHPYTLPEQRCFFLYLWLGQHVCVDVSDFSQNLATSCPAHRAQCQVHSLCGLRCMVNLNDHSCTVLSAQNMRTRAASVCRLPRLHEIHDATCCAQKRSLSPNSPLPPPLPLPSTIAIAPTIQLRSFSL